MIRMRLGPALAIALMLLAATAISAGAATKERTCFYYSNSGVGSVGDAERKFKAARHVYNDATKRITAGTFNRTIRVDGYSFKMHFDGGGNGTCTASHQRRITFNVP